MPLDFEKVWQLFELNKPKILNLSKEQIKSLNIFNKIAEKYFALSYNDLIYTLNKINTPRGSIPTEEYKNGLIIPFNIKFKNHEEALKWAFDNVKNKVSVSCDGSQIFPTDELNIPIGLVQVLSYTNFHTQNQNSYKIDREIKLITPDELIYKNKISNVSEIGNEPVDTIRFQTEMDLLSDQMELLFNSENRPENVFFLFDGSLILSFIMRFADVHQDIFLNSLKKGIDNSEKYRWPLIGFIDSSSAKDILQMLSVLDNIEIKDPNLSDSGLLEYYLYFSKNIKLNWGDRSCTFICERNDPIYLQYPSIIQSQIAFFYIKLNSLNPARVEFPTWCLKYPKIIEEIANILRIESIIGSGYPITIDNCHHKVIITNQDRLKFIRLFQKFGELNNFDVKIKNKSRAKLKFIR